ncbi:MAG: ABC transporter substrate-binding protein [Pseudonocardiaceae bacterium]
MHSTRTPRGTNRSLWALGFALILVGVSACGGGSGASSPDRPGTDSDGYYPVTVADCGGRQTTYEKAPERVFALSDQVAEMLVVLGLGDRIVGVTRFIPDEKTWPRYRAEITGLPVVGGPIDYPSQEQIVATSPDLVIGIFQSGFSERNKLPSRDGWKQFGANAFLTAGDCDEAGGTAALTDFDYLYSDLRAFDTIFGVSDRAEQVIAEMQSRVAAATAKAQGKPQLSMWNYAGEESPLIAGAPSVPNAIMTLAGVRNVFADVAEAYAEVSFEQVVNRNPDTIWIMPDSGASLGFIDEADGIETKLLSDPRVANLTAVRNKAFVTISFSTAGIGSPQNVDALESMVDQLDRIR